MPDIQKVADGADMIIDGYAFTRVGKAVRVLNLRNPAKAMLILDDSIAETTMDDIEGAIAN